MTRGGMIIRLIDVVLILLFGFISISEITRKSIIKLPESSETPPSNPDKEEIVIIGITAEGMFLVENETQATPDIRSLRSYLLKKKDYYDRRNIAMRVRIRSNWNTPIKYTMAVADICDSHQILKGMDVNRKPKR